MKKITILLFLISAVIAGIIILKTEYGNYIEIRYYEKNNTIYQGRTATIYFDYGDGYSEEKSITREISRRSVYFDIPFLSGQNELNPDNFDQENKSYALRLDLTNEDNLIEIDKIILHEGLFDVVEITGAEFLDEGYFENVKDYKVVEGHLWIQPEGSDFHYYFNNEMNSRIFEKMASNKYELLSKILLLLCLGIVTTGLVAGFKYNDSVLQMIIIASAFLVLYMSLVSRPYVHPDEDETKGAIDYYLTNWSLPAFDDPQFYNTFSPYGDTRLEDMSVYNILSGKFTYIFRYVFHLTGYYRLFGVFIFLLMVVLSSYWGKKNKAAFIPLILTPQVWYIFSYSTSDAWDFFLGYILTGEIIIEDSLFNKAMKSKKRYLGLVVFGLVAALLFMGKPNYYEVLLLAFIILFFKWIFVEYSQDVGKNEIKEVAKPEKVFRIDDKTYKNNLIYIFKRYMFTLLSFIVFFGIRWGMDYRTYGFDKMKLYDEAKALHIADAQRNYVTFKEQGYDIFKAYLISGFEPLNFKSFVGLYGKMQFHSSTLYYVLIGILYLIIFTELIIYIIKSNLKDRLRYFCIGSIIPLSYILSVYHSWTVDFQPQGRYIFPILFAIMYLLACKSKMLDRNEMKVIIPLVGCLGMISYIMYGIRAFM